MNLQPVRYDNVGETGESKLRQAKGAGQSGVFGAFAAFGANASKSSETAGDTLAPASLSKLMDVLRSSAEVRPEVVARGRALAADPSYPSADVFKEIAKRLLNG